MLSNYPPGAEYDMNAPYNQVDTPEKDFDVTCSQSLSKTVTVTTSNYVHYVEDGCEDGVGYHDEWDEFPNTNWSDEYSESGHYTPLQLIQMLKVRVEKELKELELLPIDSRHPYTKAAEVRKLKHLIEECDDWCDAETEFEEG